MAGGIAVGSTGGALAEPVIGWQGLFAIVAVLAAAVGAITVLTRAVPSLPRPAEPPQLRTVARGYISLLGQARARRTYAYVLINAVLHSGVYTWLGLYLHRRYALGPTGIGLALLGYGIPGFVLRPVIGTAADRRGRARLIPLGVAIGAACALGLAAPVPWSWRRFWSPCYPSATTSPSPSSAGSSPLYRLYRPTVAKPWGSTCSPSSSDSGSAA